MQGQTTVELGFSITAVHNKGEVTTDRVYVRSPGITDLRIHSEMTSYVRKGEMAMIPNMAVLAKVITPEMERKFKENPEENNQKMPVLHSLAMGLETKEFQDMVDRVKACLTGKVALAWVEDENETRIALNDSIWAAIAKEGNLESALSIMNAFMDFFMVTTGSESSVTGRQSDSSRLLHSEILE